MSVTEWTKKHFDFRIRSDSRVENWLLLNSFTPTLVITLIYLLICATGKRIMRNKGAYELRKILLIYDIGTIILNLHIAKELATVIYRKNHSLSCLPLTNERDSLTMRMAAALWWFYFSKCIEMLDTIFFVFRKKWNQISFLHVFHHSTMFPLWWVITKWAPGGSSFMFAMVNSVVHVFMYSYYAIASFGPRFQKYLFWKKYLTKMQLGQFIFGTLYAIRMDWIDCPFPKPLYLISSIYTILMLLMFGKFYKSSYKPKQERIGKQKTY